MMTTQTTSGNGPASKAVQKYENISEQVMARIDALTADGSMTLPSNYSVENHLRSAWLILQSTVTREGKPALQVCTKDSIATAMFDMVLQGLSVSKKQGYFIVYGNELTFQRSYFGTIALAKRTGGVKGEPVANVIYEGDEFIYEIDPKTARINIVKHSQKIENIDNTKIKGAYALVTLPDGSTQVTIMSWSQIQKAWGQGATKGNSPAHKNFAEEMAKKTVIGRACKAIINSSDDAWLYDGKNDDTEVDTVARQREAIANETKTNVEDVTYEEVATANGNNNGVSPSAQQAQTETTKNADNGEVGEEPGY